MYVLFPRIRIFRRIVNVALVHAVNQQKSIVLYCSMGYYTNCREQFVLIREYHCNWAANDDNALLILAKLLYAITYDYLIGITHGYQECLCSECFGIRKSLRRSEFKFSGTVWYFSFQIVPVGVVHINLKENIYWWRLLNPKSLRDGMGCWNRVILLWLNQHTGVKITAVVIVMYYTLFKDFAVQRRDRFLSRRLCSALSS
jgi:hypothetical protein